MEGSQSEEEPTTGTGRVKDSLQQLKEKFVPGLKISLLISLVISFAMLVIGCLKVHKCPVENRIPLFLVATGVIGIVSKFVSYIRDRILRHFEVKYVESALYTVELIFLILGSYWVYKEFQPSYTPGDKNYCDKTAYMFAFVYLTFFYGLIIVMIFGFLCFLLCVCFLAAINLRGDSGSTNRYDVEAHQPRAEEAQHIASNP